LKPALILLRSDDAPRVAELHTAAAEDPWPVQDYRNLLKLESALAMAIVRESDDSLAAFLLCQIALDTADVLMVATHPEIRRKGYARALLQSLLKRLGERGTARLTLDVAATNTAAIALYQSMQFVRDGLRPKYYKAGDKRVDAVLMSRPVARLPEP